MCCSWLLFVSCVWHYAYFLLQFHTPFLSRRVAPSVPFPHARFMWCTTTSSVYGKVSESHDLSNKARYTRYKHSHCPKTSKEIRTSAMTHPSPQQRMGTVSHRPEHPLKNMCLVNHSTILAHTHARAHTHTHTHTYIHTYIHI